MTVYEMNKAMYAGVEPLSDFDGATKIILRYLKAHPSKYYLLLNNEKHYYTVFTFTNGLTFKPMAREIIDIVKNLGPVKDITENDNGAVECWIEYQGETVMFVLFDYSKGVIEVG